ncbi:MAG: lysophospholipid acyltransferase family protein [Thermodesulfobacteriota bacterium]
MDKTIRALKGLGMAFMFGTFGLGIFVFLFGIIPLSWVLNRFAGEKPRVERAARVGFGWWLGFMGVLGLVRSAPHRGNVFPGPCVVVANHPGLFDVLFLIRDIPSLSVLVKAGLARKLPLGPVLRALEYVLVPDYDRVNPLDTAEETLDKIQKGRKVLLFPEGTRSPSGSLRPFRAGAFKIARMTGAPIQPVLIRNTPPFMPKEDPWYLPPRRTSLLELEFWDPLPPPEKGGERSFARSLEQRYREALEPA